MKTSGSKNGFSVVISAHNKEKVIRYTLHSAWIALQCLQRFDLAPVEIIVVDHDSTDRTAEIALASGARVIKPHRRSKVSNEMAGVFAARYSNVVTVNADNLVSPLTFVKIWNEYKKGNLKATEVSA